MRPGDIVELLGSDHFWHCSDMQQRNDNMLYHHTNNNRLYMGIDLAYRLLLPGHNSNQSGTKQYMNLNYIWAYHPRRYMDGCKNHNGLYCCLYLHMNHRKALDNSNYRSAFCILCLYMMQCHCLGLGMRYCANHSLWCRHFRRCCYKHADLNHNPCSCRSCKSDWRWHSLYRLSNCLSCCMSALYFHCIVSYPERSLDSMCPWMCCIHRYTMYRLSNCLSCCMSAVCFRCIVSNQARSLDNSLRWMDCIHRCRPIRYRTTGRWNKSAAWIHCIVWMCLYSFHNRFRCTRHSNNSQAIPIRRCCKS